MERVLAAVEKGILVALMVMMALLLILATLDLAWTIITAVAQPPYLILTLETLLQLFGMFLLVLVGLELLDTIKAYAKEHIVHAEIVLLAAMIAVARKVITLEIKELAPGIPYGIAALVLALSAAYFLLKRAGVDRATAREP